jgi:xanthine dehydrogenase iron-sulfur cluster and FAD-binding subunit A
MKLHAVQQHRLRYDRYLRPESIGEALEMLATHGGTARLIAGGTDLLLEMTRGMRPEVDTLIDLSLIPALGGIEVSNDSLLIGAGITHNEIVTSPLVIERALPLAQACWEIASPQLRNRATVVGNLVTASPANDTITPLRALGTVLEIASATQRREVDLADFHRGVRTVDLGPDEMITGLRVRALHDNEQGLFVKVGLRKAQAISVVHVALVLEWDGPLIRSARIALGSVAPTIVMATAAEAFLIGKRLTEEVIDEASGLVADQPSPIDDLRATASYRRSALRTATTRALASLAAGEERDGLPVNPVTLGKRTFAFEGKINGRPVKGDIGYGTLLDWLRSLGLTGTKEGCAEGECGACTVYLDGVAVMSCLVPAGRAADAEITTIEGLGTNSDLHPLQQAFLDRGAVQCGFCIPGFLMSGAKLLEERAHPSGAEIRTAFAGNLCRCTGYYKIVEAVEAVGKR